MMKNKWKKKSRNNQPMSTVRYMDSKNLSARGQNTYYANADVIFFLFYWWLFYWRTRLDGGRSGPTNLCDIFFFFLLLRLAPHTLPKFDYYTCIVQNWERLEVVSIVTVVSINVAFYWSFRKLKFHFQSQNTLSRYLSIQLLNQPWNCFPKAMLSNITMATIGFVHIYWVFSLIPDDFHFLIGSWVNNSLCNQSKLNSVRKEERRVGGSCKWERA